MAMDYREYILDHYRNPRNYGKLEHPIVHSEDSNPLCGDQLALDLQIENDLVTAVRFQGRGFAIYPACHLTAVHDVIFPLFGFGKRLHAKLDVAVNSNHENTQATVPRATHIS